MGTHGYPWVPIGANTPGTHWGVPRVHIWEVSLVPIGEYPWYPLERTPGTHWGVPLVPIGEYPRYPLGSTPGDNECFRGYYCWNIIIFGRLFSCLTNGTMEGAMTPPSRAATEQTPIPLFLKEHEQHYLLFINAQDSLDNLIGQIKASSRGGVY